MSQSAHSVQLGSKTLCRPYGKPNTYAPESPIRIFFLGMAVSRRKHTINAQMRGSSKDCCFIYIFRKAERIWGAMHCPHGTIGHRKVRFEKEAKQAFPCRLIVSDEACL